MWTWNELKALLRKKAADDFSKTIYVMWPAYYPYVVESKYVKEDLHATIIFIGEMTDDMGYTKEDVIDAIKATNYDRFLWANVSGVEWFGEEKNIPVLRIEHDELHLYRDALESEFNKRGIPVDNKFPIFKPHVSTLPEAVEAGIVPEHVMLAPVELWWGLEHVKISNTEGHPNGD